jgi:flagellar protein FlgJ
MVKNISQAPTAPVEPQTNGGLSKIPKKDSRDPRIMAAAKMYEQEFLREMVTAMRKAVPKSDLTKESMGEKIFNDQLYDQYVEQWSNVGGVGLSDMIYDQVIEKFGPQQRIEHPKGPMPIDPHKTFQIENKSPSAGAGLNGTTGAMLLQITPQKNSEDSKILMPWKGEVVGVQNLESGEKATFIKHENGLRSTFLFKGNLAGNKKDFGPGETLADLSSENKNFLWKLEGT